MYITEITQLKAVCLHHIGSKAIEEGVTLSHQVLELDEVSRKNLYTYCFSSFKNDEKYVFYNQLGLKYNETMACIKKIFADKDSLLEQSQNLAKLLYGKSEHPGIKSGDLIVAYFADCEIDGYITDAIGLYKCENTTHFLSLNYQGNKAGITSLEGLDLRRVDKAALIFNVDSEQGYSLAVIDNNNKGEAKYWVDDFLQAKPKADEYHHTRALLNAAKGFITKSMPEDVTKGEKAELMDKTLRYFQENDTFDMEDFSSKVMGDERLSSDFGAYMGSFMEKNDIEMPDQFSISESAVKKSSRSMKSVIKLDKNFHIYVHGGEGLIRKGYDPESGMAFYQLYFKEEE